MLEVLTTPSPQMSAVLSLLALQIRRREETRSPQEIGIGCSSEHVETILIPLATHPLSVVLPAAYECAAYLRRPESTLPFVKGAS